LPKGGLADAEREVVERASSLGHMGRVGFALFVREDRDQASVARIEVDVTFVRIVEVGLVEDERHAQYAFPEIDRCLPVGANNRYVMDTLRLDLSQIITFFHGFPFRAPVQREPDQSTSFDL